MSSFPRKKVKWFPSKDLEILTIDWIECDETEPRKEYQDYEEYRQALEEGGDEDKKLHNKNYTIFAFGVTIEGYSVCAKIVNYNPYFYIKIPELLKTNQQLKNKFMAEFFNKDELNWNKVNKYNNLDKLEDDTEPKNYAAKKRENRNTHLLNLRNKIGAKENKSSLLNTEIEEKNAEIFWSFTNNTKYDFWKLSFQSKEGFHLFNNFFKVNKHYPNITDKSDPDKTKYYKLEFKLFESELEPLLRFFHDTKIKPSNWVKFPKKSYKLKPNMSSCQINVEIDWDKVIPIEKDAIPPLIVASFDIEADSSHGDFPLAKKDYKKLANELVVSYLTKKFKLSKLVRSTQEYRDINKELISPLFFKKRIIQAFDLDNHFYTKKDVEMIDDTISRVFFKKRNIKSKRDNDFLIRNILTSSKIDELCDKLLFICNRPIKKVIANQKMKAAIASINIQYERLEEYRFNKYKSNTKMMKQCTIHDLLNIIKKTSQSTKIPFNDLKHKILTKDILVKYCNQELTFLFPQVKGDKVIQIGTTFWRYGDDKPIYNNMITLKQCSELPNIDTYSFEKEKDVILEWTKMIRIYDPDIILGYNIFGFDEVFMYDRANELIAKGNPNNEKYLKFLNMGRLNSDTYKNIWSCRGKLMKKKLASSALGANYLEYFNMPGRVQIDLLKVVQAGMTKLDSYKLDSVAEFYIGGKISNIIEDETQSQSQLQSQWIELSNIKELEVGNYIIITLKTGEKVLNGKKLIIENINYEENKIKLTEPIPKKILSLDPKWGLAKDDVTPKQIFEFQKGTDEQRGIIAKYCIQDCALVVRLLKKLDTIVNNFGMSNVCLVPFSYIFMRGQGIKIFSLIVNECSLNGFVLPMLEKINVEEEEEDLTNTNIPNQQHSILNLVNNDNDNDDDTDNQFTLGENFNKIMITGDGYEGAIVLEPKPGIYTEDPVTVLDFSSLYPSEMIASNLSHDSHCEDPFWLGDEGAKRLKKLGYDYLDVEYDVYSWKDPTNHNKGKKKTGVTVERFVQYPDGKKGLIPNIEKKLLGARKATKKRMKNESDPFKYSILDGLQLAYKLTANSLYGQIGASTSKIYKKAIAASTTAGGRKCIYRAKDYCLKNNPGCDVVYGDSVVGDTPLLLRNKTSKEISIHRIDELGDGEWKTYDNFKIFSKDVSSKYKKTCEQYEVYTSSGWKNIRKIIKHKTTKKIYRVSTQNSVVDVTEDHSLLDNELNEIKPMNAEIGMELRHDYPFNHYISDLTSNIINNTINNIEYIDNYNVTLKEAFLNGVFLGLGECNENETGNIWLMKVKTYEMAIKLQSLLNSIYEDKFEVKEVSYSPSCYHIFPKHNCEIYYNLFSIFNYKNENKIVPDFYLNCSNILKTIYLAGFYYSNYDNNSSLKNNDITTAKLNTNSKIEASMMYYLTTSIGLNVDVINNDLSDIYELLILFKKDIRFNDNETLKKVEYVKTINNDEYVYDIETEIGNFNCGFPLIVKNTDSVFVKFNLAYEDGSYPKTDQEKVQRSIDIGLALQQKLKDEQYYTPPHDLEYEKVFYPLMLITKKRYAGEKYEFEATKSKFTSMGIVLKRRDNAPILKHTYGGVMTKIMKEKNIQGAIDFVKLCCQEIIDNKYELNMFVISKTLRDYYKDPESIAHKVLADRMTERDPGNKPASNERIPYAYIKVEEKEDVKLLQGDKIEHVNYIQENNLELDYSIYIKNQLLKPICQIFELVVESMEGFPYHPDHFNNLYYIYLDKYKGDKKKTEKKISDEKQKVVAKLIFEPFMIEAINIQNDVNTLDDWMIELPEDDSIIIKPKPKPLNKQIDKKPFKLKKQTNISDFFG